MKLKLNVSLSEDVVELSVFDYVVDLDFVAVVTVNVKVYVLVCGLGSVSVIVTVIVKLPTLEDEGLKLMTPLLY